MILANLPTGSRKAAARSPLPKSPLFQAQLPQQHLFNRQVLQPLLHWRPSTELTPSYQGLSCPGEYKTGYRTLDAFQQVLSQRVPSYSSYSPTPVRELSFVQALCYEVHCWLTFSLLLIRITRAAAQLLSLSIFCTVVGD